VLPFNVVGWRAQSSLRPKLRITHREFVFV
jgi:hypothetical protein